jgi:quercetin dioxygenase-like cupin family protein
MSSSVNINVSGKTATAPPQDMEAWLKKALSRWNDCSFCPAMTHEWESTNSSVVSLPAFNFGRMFGTTNFQNIACSLVSISGPTDEALHFHTSHVVGVVTSGAGRLRHTAIGKSIERQTVLKTGDVAFIPKNCLHLFDTDEGGHINYVAFEVSEDEIDYQKHWHAEDNSN